MAARKPAPSKSAASADASPTAAARQEELTRAYRDMLLIRRFEERAGQLYGMGLIGGFCHLYIGQEAVVVGLTAARSAVSVRSSASLAMIANSPKSPCTAW